MKKLKYSFELLLNQLNEIGTQTSGDWAEDLPKHIREDYVKGNIVAKELDTDPHRWYETAIDVFKFKDRFIGVSYVNRSYSEMQEIEDIMWELDFFEMEEIQSVTYKVKEDE